MRAQVIESCRHHGYLNLFAERSPLRRVASELIAELGSSRTGSATREISAATIGGQGNDALGVHCVEVNGALSATVHEQRVAVSFSGRLTAHDWWDFDTRLGEMAAGTSRRTWGAEAAVGVIHDVARGQPFAVNSEAVGVQQDMSDDTASITQ